MGIDELRRVVGLLEEANSALAATVTPRAETEQLLAWYARAERLAAYGTAALSARLGDASELARVAGTSVGRARRVIETARVVAGSPVLAEAMQSGAVSVEQAGEIARTASVAPESVGELVDVARGESFQVLTERARSVRVAAVDRAGLGERQHRARRLRHWVGELGMVHVNAVLEPHVGARVVNRLEDEARRRARAARSNGRPAEPFERYLADALGAVTGDGAESPGRTELVVLVSHEVTRRGWRDVRDGEHCKIPGVGPVPPEIAHEITRNAFLTGVLYDGTDLRHVRRWTRHIPTEIRIALNLGDPPGFDAPHASTAAAATAWKSTMSSRSQPGAPPRWATTSGAAPTATTPKHASTKPTYAAAARRHGSHSHKHPSPSRRDPGGPRPSRPANRGAGGGAAA
jgi:hypothetical protein